MEIKVDGTVISRKPKGNTFKLAEMQETVNGLIEAIYLPRHKVYMIINEEGKLLDLAQNDIATNIFREEFYPTKDYIVGDVLIIQENEIE